MAKNKKKPLNNKSRKNQSNRLLKYEKNNTKPWNAKIALIIFGLGPIIIMGWFLYSNNFFS